MTDGIDQRLVFAAQRLPIVAMHVRDIEIIAVAAPHFGENLVPLLARGRVWS